MSNFNPRNVPCELIKRLVSAGVISFALLFVGVALAHAQSYTPNEQACYIMVQGKISWSRNGSTQWAEQNARDLCRGTTLPARTVECFRGQIASHNDWQRGIRECRPETMSGNPPPAGAAAAPALNLNGNWMGYFADNTKSAYVWAINQSGAALSFLDIGGTNTRFSGTLQGTRITDSNGKTGTVSADGKNIRWSDGVIWVRQNQPPTDTNPTGTTKAPEPRSVPVSANSSSASLLSPSEMNSVMSWIAARVSADRLPFCYRQSFTRGIGETLTGNCPSGLEKSGALCYPKCQNGYRGEGPVCWGTCPAGFTDIGAFCQKPAAYGRGAGYPWKFGDGLNLNNAVSRCERDNGAGNCEKYGEIIYPKCRAGFSNVGSNICSPTCPAGYTDTGTGCAKPQYGRGAGQTLACRAGLEQSGLQCFEGCNKAGYTGVNFVCWQNCPSQQPVNCGAGCATTQKECGMAISDMAISPVMAAVSIASLGTASGATAGVNAAKNATVAATKSAQIIARMKNIYNTLKPAIKAAEAANNAYTVASTVKDQVDLVSAEFADNFSDMTTPEINAKIDASFSPAAARAVKVQWAKRHFILMGQTNLDATFKNVLTLASVVDPTGLLAVENAFYHPVCKNDTPFPSITRR